MSKETHSQDSSFEEVWKEMDKIEPLTPSTKQNDYFESYCLAAEQDNYMFGDYNYEKYWVGISTNDIY